MQNDSMNGFQVAAQLGVTLHLDNVDWGSHYEVGFNDIKQLDWLEHHIVMFMLVVLD